jgi:hypothetical protein
MLSTKEITYHPTNERMQSSHERFQHRNLPNFATAYTAILTKTPAVTIISPHLHGAMYRLPSSLSNSAEHTSTCAQILTAARSQGGCRKPSRPSDAQSPGYHNNSLRRYNLLYAIIKFTNTEGSSDVEVRTAGSSNFQRGRVYERAEGSSDNVEVRTAGSSNFRQKSSTRHSA